VCLQQVIVQDLQSPTLSCPADVTVSAGAGTCSASGVVLGSPTASDNCGAVTLTNNAPAQFPTGTNFVQWTATDSRGNIQTCQQRVVVLDTEAPAITCPTNIIVLAADSGQCSRSNVTFTVTATDNCSGVIIVSTPPSGSTFPIGTTIVTNIATDASGNQTTCTFSLNVFAVTVNDTQPPVITCPTNLVLAASPGQCSASNVTFVVTATDNCVVTNLVSVPASGSTFPLGVTTVTNTATDAGGNTASCTFTVTVQDVQSPTLNCPANITVGTAGGGCASNVTFSVTASDNCGSVSSLVSVPASGSSFPLGVTTVSNTATDSNGNTSTCSFTVTVLDVQSPSITCSTNITVVATPGQSNAVVSFAASTAADNCSGVVVSNSPPSGSAFPVGTTTVTGTATDASGNQTSCSFSVTVVRGNAAPVAIDSNLSTPEDTALPITLTGSDLEGSPLTFILVSGPANGLLSGFNTNTGALTYTPSTNFNGADSLTFRVSDGTNLSAVATISINVTPVNDAPFANNQSVNTSEDTALPITLTGSDVEGSSLTFSIVGSPLNGTVTGLNTNTGALTYTPGTNFNGADSFTFRVNDGSLNSALATVSITVTPLNDAPIANNDIAGTPKNVPVTINVLANDSDVDGNPISLTSASATNGTVNIVGTNLFFTPASNYLGQVVLGYSITDGQGGNASAVVFVTVTPGTNTPPVANPDVISIPEDTTLTFDPRGNDTDADGDPFVITNVTATNGTVTLLGGTNITFRAPTNFTGTIFVTYTINDGNGGTSTAVITVNVTPVNDAPFANDQLLNTPEETALPITLTGSDLESSPLTFILVSGPSNGSISGFNTNTGSLTYTPGLNYNGADAFTFRTSDGTNTSAIATVGINVTPVNDVPTGNNQNVSTPEDTALPITLTGSDVESSPLTFILVGGPANGSVSGFNPATGAFTYTPNTNYNGSDAITFRVSDGSSTSAVATVTINITPVNDAPIANNQSVSTPEDSALGITLVGSDVDLNGLTYSIVAGPTHGTISGFNASAGTLTYTPATNYNGADAFTFRVNDGLLDSAIATVTINVTPVTDNPVILNDSTNTPSGQPVVVPPLVNDTDPDGGTLSLCGATATNGIATISGTNIIFNANSNFIGTASVTYCATNQTGGTGSGTITINVQPPLLPTLVFAQSGNTLNPQSGLFEQRISITNVGVTTASALRVLVGNINSPLGVPRTNVWLYNASGTNVDSRPYVLYNAPLNPGQFVTLTLEFVVPDRRAFTNSIEVVSVLPVATGTNSGGGVAIDRWFLDNRFSPSRLVIEWASIPGRSYTVIYSDDNMATWRAATPSVNAVNNRTQWYDDGAPKTVSAPTSIGSRFYRVILAPINNNN
jgi:hypothetical protein